MRLMGFLWILAHPRRYLAHRRSVAKLNGYLDTIAEMTDKERWTTFLNSQGIYYQSYIDNDSDNERFILDTALGEAYFNIEEQLTRLENN
jgi:hypothetical protein